MQAFRSAVMEVRNPATTNPLPKDHRCTTCYCSAAGSLTVAVRWGGAHWQVLMSIYPQAVLLFDRIFFLLFLLLHKLYPFENKREISLTVTNRVIYQNIWGDLR